MMNGAALRLRVYDPEAIGESDFSLCTLREFFERWYLPQVLHDALQRERPAAKTTVGLYRDALGYWERLTRNPVAEEICDADADAVAFIEGLKTATFRRSRFGDDRQLSPSTRAKHVSTVRALLAKLTDDGRGKALSVLPRRIRIRRPSVDALPKATPPLALFRDIVTRLRTDSAFSCLAIPAPSGSEPVLWWRALLGTLYAHGWRLQTALAIKKGMIAAEEITRLRVPGEAVGKTHKAAIRPVPPWLATLWAEAHVEGPFILGSPCSQRWLFEGWQRIQKAAGIDAGYSLHSIRRLHGVEIGKTGFHAAEALSQNSLQHADAATTRAHYVGADLLEVAILRLPAVA